MEQVHVCMHMDICMCTHIHKATKLHKTIMLYIFTQILTKREKFDIATSSVEFQYF